MTINSIQTKYNSIQKPTSTKKEEKKHEIQKNNSNRKIYWALGGLAVLGMVALSYKKINKLKLSKSDDIKPNIEEPVSSTKSLR